MQTKTHIRFHGDIADPYSYLGRALFDKAHAEFGSNVFDIETAPFEVNPDLSVNGMPFDQYLLARYGEQAEVAKALLPLTKAVNSDGLALAIDKIKIMPNTHAAHRMLGWSRGLQADYDLFVRLQEAFFVYGLDVGNLAVLRAQADAVGLDGKLFAQLLTDPASEDTILDEITAHAKAGVTQVPLWVIGGTYAVQGVQTVQFWRDVIGEIDAKGRALANTAIN